MPLTCTVGDFLAASDKLGQPLLADVDIDPTTQLGRWQVRIQCQAANEVEVQIARTRNGTKFSRDPIIKEKTDGTPNLFDWSHPQSALLNRDGLCGQAESTTENFQIERGTICTVSGTAVPVCITTGGNSPNCPCTAPEPDPCPTGFITSHVIDDSFGGSDNSWSGTHGGVILYTYGRQRLRYCAPK